MPLFVISKDEEKKKEPEAPEAVSKDPFSISIIPPEKLIFK